VISYTTLGFLGGLAGGVFVSLRGISFWLNGILGMGMIAMGVLTLLSRSFTVSSSLRKERARWAPANLLAGVAGSENTGGGFALGILTPLLPCGMLYAMVMRASAEAQPVTGALLMLAYSLGTVPAMMIIGMVSSMGLMRFRGYAEMVAACAVILMGLLLLLKAFHAPSMTMVHG
jgi:sulfite exporter TauE/SafE